MKDWAIQGRCQPLLEKLKSLQEKSKGAKQKKKGGGFGLLSKSTKEEIIRIIKKTKRK